MTDISEILNSEAHDAPSVARRAMAIIRCLEAGRDEARGVAREYRADLKALLTDHHWEKQYARDPLQFPWLEPAEETP